MPRYEYHCKANGKTVEVSHCMDNQLDTWGELCACAEIAPGKTPADSPVEKLISTGFVAGSKGHDEPPPGGCGSGCCCMNN